jgi:hypothetical protein
MTSAGVGDRLVPARNAGDACARRREPGADLVAHRLDGTRRRSDEGRTGGGDRSGERRVLGEEPVSRMHRVGTATGEDIQDGSAHEVALGRGLAAQGVGLVGETDMKRIAVELGVDRDRRNLELAAGPDDPYGDLTAVGDEHLVEHRPSFLASCPNGAGAASRRTTRAGVLSRAGYPRASRRRSRRHGARPQREAGSLRSAGAPAGCRLDEPVPGQPRRCRVARWLGGPRRLWRGGRSPDRRPRPAREELASSARHRGAVLDPAQAGSGPGTSFISLRGPWRSRQLEPAGRPPGSSCR